ncbi:MAG: serine/threonine protein kinase [Ktedonobacterales bacterium]
MANLTTVCSNCGLRNDAGSTLCVGCGRPLAADSSLSTPDSNAPGSPPVGIDSSATGFLAPGTILNGRYQILGVAGTGGMGAVYKAADTHLGGRIAALKEMSEYGLTPEEVQAATETFHHEARLLAGLHHPSLPNIHDHFNAGGRWYLVMDFIDGETLQEHLARYGTPGLPVAEVLRLADQICAVLEFLHRQTPPVIFRDLKPSNIMITAGNQLYLIDFGIARLFKPGQATDTISLGSAGYAAPEQYGRSQTTVQSDVYSLGVTLHQLLSGLDPADKPFTFPLIRPRNPQTPPQLEMLVLSMVQLDESRRPANIAQVRRSLRQIAQQISSVRLARPAPPPYRTSPAYPLPVSPPAAPLASSPVKATARKSKRRRSRSGLKVFALFAATIAILCAGALIYSTASGAMHNSEESAAATAAAESTVTADQQVLAVDQTSLTQSLAGLVPESSFADELTIYARAWKLMQEDYKKEQSDFKQGCSVSGNAYQVQTIDADKIKADLQSIQSDDVVLALLSDQASGDIQVVQSHQSVLQSALQALVSGPTGSLTSASVTASVSSAQAELLTAEQQINNSQKAIQSAEAKGVTYEQEAAETNTAAQNLAKSMHC